MVIRRIKILCAYLLFIAVGIYILSFPALAVSRGILIKAQTSSGSPRQIKLYSGYHALVVGCGDYRAGWPKLPNPVNDAREVAFTLKKMNWQVELLEDPVWDRLDAALNRLITGPGRARDRAVLFWFSGHGHTLEEADGTKLGYIVPVDAPRPAQDETGFMRRAIDMRQIETVAKRIRSKHVLMVFDSCFSGALFSMVRSAPSHYIEEKIAAPVREFITAGRENEQVPDQSVFKTVFIQGITDGYADMNRDGYVTGEELGAYLQENVINYSRKAQHPQFGKINNPRLDKGDFVFVLKRSEQFSQPQTIASKLESENQRLAQEAARIERERQELEQLKTLLEQKKELAAESQRLEGEKLKLASIPERVTAPRVTLRKKPIMLSMERNIENMLVKYGFFDISRNPTGSFDNIFVDNNDGTITDKATGLMWQKRGSLKLLKNKEAKIYIRRLNNERFAGHSDWRMPTIEELASILEQSRNNGVHIDTFFSSEQNRCWSADQTNSGAGYDTYIDAVWIVRFEYGEITMARWCRHAWNVCSGAHNLFDSNYVKAVRSIK